MSTSAYRNFFAMGTRLDIIFPDMDDNTADNVSLRIKKEIDYLEDKISNYRDDSFLNMINRNAAKKPVIADEYFISLIQELKRLSENTLGYFDFAVNSSLLNLLTGERNQADNAIAAAIPEGHYYRFIETNPDKKTVLFKNELVRIDSGGFGKGLALDAVRKCLENEDVSSAFISFGESSILAHGHHPYGSSWKTGVRNAFIENENVFTFDLLDSFLSTSGITPRNLEKYESGHIINPFTGKNIDTYITVAVAGNSGLETEVLSTALLIASQPERDEMMSFFPGYSAIVIEYDESRKPLIACRYH